MDVFLFEILADSKPEDVDRLGELTTVFEHLYVRGRRQRGRGSNYASALFQTELGDKM